MDSFLITLVIVVIAALSNWLQQRAQAHRENQPPPATHPPRPRPPVRGVRPPPLEPPPSMETTLEREIRRLLGEEVPAEPAAPPPVPRRAPEPPLHQPVVPIAPAPVETKATSSRAEKWAEGYERAQHLHETVTDRLRRVDELTEQHGNRPMRRLGQAPSTLPRPLWALRQQREAARQAFVASLVFGPPKGLEP